MEVDPETVRMLKDGATGTAALVAAYVGLKGLDAWKRQLRGTSDYKLARRLLKLTYQARDKIQRIRAPMKFGAEFEQALEEQDIDLEEGEEPTKLQKTEAWYQMHWEGLNEILSDLKVAQLEAEALWGPHIPEVFSSLNEVIGELQVAISQQLRFIKGGPHVDPTAEQREEVRNILYRRSWDPDEDDFTAKIEGAVADVREEARPYLTSG